MSNWKIFKGTGEPHDGIEELPPPPGWRDFPRKNQGSTYQPRGIEIDVVNAALYLRRPLLVTGKPGTGKSSLAYAIAHELKLGTVLKWSITTRSTLEEGLYRYDAIGRIQDAKERQQESLEEIGRYIQLGPLGTAFFPTARPRVLLVDEIDKSDIDLPNNLLNIFEEGEFEIRELSRISDKLPKVQVQTYDGRKEWVEGGKICCQAFPCVIMTSNQEREFPPAFLRRCLRLDIPEPNEEELSRIVRAHLGKEVQEQAQPIIETFLKCRQNALLATDQLLNAIYLVTNEKRPTDQDKDKLIEILLRELSNLGD